MKKIDLSSFALLMLVGVFAIGLLALSWPRLQATMVYLPVDTAISKYYATGIIPTSQLPGLIEQAAQAINEHDHYRYHDGLSTLYYLRGLDDKTPTLDRRPAFEKSIMEAESAVSQAPARPMTWQRIARTRALLGHTPQFILPPLKMSIFTGRVEPTLLLGRLELGYFYINELDDETRGLIKDQTLLTWKLQPRELTRLITAGNISWENVKTILDDQTIREMEAALGLVVQ